MNQPSSRHDSETGITVSNLAISFGEMPPIFSNLSMRIEPGEFVALVGASGCGKTTLMNAIAGLVPASEGDVEVNNLRPMAGRSDIAYVLARDALLPWRTVRGNVEYALMLSGFPKDERKPIALDYLQRVGLGVHTESLPARLSHGQRQRVALARAFAVNRSVYMLDEPFSALDAQTKLVLHDQLLSLWEQSRKTVIFVTHDIGEAVTLADRVIVMGTHGRGIVDEIQVPLPRPRSASELQENEQYHHIYRQAWHALRKGMS
ncbi:MAG: ABC transporter ATP-binding protein [Burkholderiaceae bacterium]|nr:ABC transporter ATP-binding protein [Burkholderiaceae bacterium]